MRLRSPSQIRVEADGLKPIKVGNPELLAPFARAVNNAKCPACQAPVVGLIDSGANGPLIQVTCFGEPAHAFFFDIGSGHIADRPLSFGEIAETERVSR